ncbi:MAG: SMC family ATPase, partial [Halioglobus sp.]
MKPIFLKMQAFGPFASAQSITFSDLGDSPLFLINGPTGSGKTTVLDAICYALYGSTTGNERDAKDMRCQQSEADLLTEITFEFRLAGNSYRIIRSPDQERPKKTGSGFTTHKTRADLYKLGPDGEAQSGELLVEKKVSEATEYIREITGLNAEQFRQVMVLPQGQFRKLLLADSKDKQKIFQSLFQTSVYSRIEDQLKEDSKEVRDAVGQAQSVIRNILETGGVDSEEDLALKMELTSLELGSLSSAKEKAQITWLAADRVLRDATGLKADFENFDKVKQREAELQDHSTQIQLDRTQAQQAHTAQKLMPVFIRVAEAELALDKTNEEIAAAESVLVAVQETRTVAEAGFASEKNRQAERSAAVAKVHQLNSYAGKAEQLIEAKAEQDAALAHEAGQKVSRGECVQVLETHMRGEGELQHKVESLQKAISSAEGIDQKVHKLAAAVKSRKQLSTLESTLGDAEQGLGRARQQLAAAESAKVSAEKTVKRLRQTWHQEQAALLAEDLKEGSPCPVCGSA